MTWSARTFRRWDEAFSRSEFDTATGACRARSAPGLDGISYEILRKFSDEMYSFMPVQLHVPGLIISVILEAYLCYIFAEAAW